MSLPPENPYQTIKRSIADGIATGQWGVGAALPSESALTRQFRVSRMTVSRAMRELANENLIRRVAGVGSFVADPVAQSALVEIRNIADEIAARGHVHSARVLELDRVAVPEAMAADFGVAAGAAVYFSRIVHAEDGMPVQLEERFVNPAMAPDYLRQDYQRITPNAYLSRVAPLHRVEHQVRAVLPSTMQSVQLCLEPGEACLLVLRRTWSCGRLVSVATLAHPGSRFALSGRFFP